MALTVTATIGGLTIQGTEGPVSGSDTGWNRDITVQQSRPLGSQIDVVLQMALGSHVRSFSLFLTRARFQAFYALQGTVVRFTDWEGDIRNVYVRRVAREGSSRPFIYRTSIELVEQ